jgi:replication factor C subunit 1
MSASFLWVDRYKPTKLSEVIGHKESLEDLYKWLSTWTPTSKPILITGPPGIGKTTLAHLIAKRCRYEVIEVNASEDRSAAAVRKLFQTATTASLDTPRMMILDEVDGMSSGDRGGIAAIAAALPTCTFPALCIANEKGNPQKMRPLAAVCTTIKMARPVKSTIAKALYAKLVTPLKLPMALSAVEDLVEQSGNDIRSVINTLQFYASSAVVSSGEKDGVLRLDAFSAAGKLFNSSAPLTVRSELVFVDYGMVPLMVGEAYIAASKACIERCAAAADAYTFYDLLDTKIYRGQHWDLMPHAVQAVVATATEAGGPAPWNLFPTWLGKQSKGAKHRRWHRDLSRRIGSDAIDAKEVLRLRLFQPRSTPKEIVAQLGELHMNRDDMLEVLTDTIFEGDEALVKLDTKIKSGITREWNKIHPAVKKEVAADEDAATEADSEEEI